MTKDKEPSSSTNEVNHEASDEATIDRLCYGLKIVLRAKDLEEAKRTAAEALSSVGRRVDAQE